MIGPIATGFATGLSLIMAIGAQNAFILRQGLLKQHVFWLCLFCAASDAILITAGVAGFGHVTALWPWLPRVMTLGGAAFLLWYGFSRLRAAAKGQYSLILEGEARSLLPSLLTAAAFTWLNPHVYLDTLALIGAVSVPFLGADKVAFGLGAVTASFVFFFGLGYGARLLAPIMQSAKSWRVLDVIVGLVMWLLAAKLLLG